MKKNQSLPFHYISCFKTTYTGTSFLVLVSVLSDCQLSFWCVHNKLLFITTLVIHSFYFCHVFSFDKYKTRMQETNLVLSESPANRCEVQHLRFFLKASLQGSLLGFVSGCQGLRKGAEATSPGTPHSLPARAACRHPGHHHLGS